MAKFNVGNVVVIKNDEELLARNNIAQKLAAMLCGFHVDNIEAGMTGVILDIDSNDICTVDLGETFKGATVDGQPDGTCTGITADLLELATVTCEEAMCSCEECRESFKPHLVYVGNNSFCGYIGEPTSLKTSKGNPLYIGDVVVADDDYLAVVVKDEDGEYFMGYKGMVFGVFSAPDKVVKKFSYDLPWNEDIISKIKYVKELECDE